MKIIIKSCKIPKIFILSSYFDFQMANMSLYTTHTACSNLFRWKIQSIISYLCFILETIKPSKPEEGTSSVTQPNVEPANEILENVPHDLPEVTNETENDNVENVQSEASIVPSAENTPESVHDNSSENVVKNEQIKESVVNEEEEESSQGNEQVTNQIEEENENSQVDEQMTNQIKEEDIKVTSDLNTNTNESESKNNVKVEKENSDNEADSSKKSNSKLDLCDFDIPKIEEKSQTNTVPPPVVSMEPPPLFDDDEKSKEKDPLKSE